MGSFFDSLRKCLWPSGPSYDLLPDSESEQQGQYLPHVDHTVSKKSLPLGTSPSCQYTVDPSMARFGIEGRSPTSWQVLLYFASYCDNLRKGKPPNDPNSYWCADLDIITTDIVGLMREGLYVSQDNVKVQDNHVRWGRHPRDQTKWMWYRHYTLVHPKWSGRLVVQTVSFELASEFRLEHLSADGVYKARAQAMAGFDNSVYWYEVRNPHASRMNFILDDEPLPGLWPWPKKEPDGQDEEGCDWEKVQ